MKKILLILTGLFISINTSKASSYVQDINGDIFMKYHFNMLSNKNNKYLYTDSMVNGYLEVISKQNATIFKNLFFKTNIRFKNFGNRIYDGSYGFHNGINNNNHSRDDFYGKEDYLKRKLYFSHYSLILEEVVLEFKEDSFVFGLGKFNPLFGIAYDEMKLSGNNRTLFPEEYALREKIGAYIGIDFEFFKFYIQSFYDDTTFLSSDLFGVRNIDNSIGGAGNTKKLNNVAVYSEITVNDLKFNLGFRRLAVSQLNEEAEKGYIIGVQKYIAETGFGPGLNPLFEIGYFDNFDGVKKRDIVIGTVRLPVFYQGWTFTVSHSNKFDFETKYKDYTSYLTEIGIGYKFQNGLMVNLSRKWHKEANKIAEIIKTKEVHKFDSFDLTFSYIYNY